MNKEKNLKDQRASLRVDTRETQHIGAADLMAGTSRQARPEINPVVTVGWRPTN